MKKISLLLAILILVAALSGCAAGPDPVPVLATTAPVYQFAQHLCRDTDIPVSQLITENVSCLHDYTLQVSQMRMAESAQLILLSGGGLEDFLGDLLAEDKCVDTSSGVVLIDCGEEHDHDHAHTHTHESDPHIWLSPVNAKIMVCNIADALAVQYPRYADMISLNLEKLLADLDELYAYGNRTLSQLGSREIITFHDGFSYFAEAFDLTILEAIEEESGSEASARELKELILLVEEHQLPAIFIEANGSVSAASVIARETGAAVCTLDMAMGGSDYFEAMYHNIDTIREALG